MAGFFNIGLAVAAAVGAVVAGILISVPILNEVWHSILVASVLFLVFVVLTILIVEQIRHTIQTELDSRLPEIKFIVGEDDITKSMRRLVQNANELIFASGSASRDFEYLKGIEDRIESGVQYTRLVYMWQMRDVMINHLRIVLGKPCVDIWYADDAHHGYFLITEDGSILVFPGRVHAASLALYFQGEEHNRKIQRHFTALLSRSMPIRSEIELENMIERVQGRSALQKDAS